MTRSRIWGAVCALVLVGTLAPGRALATPHGRGTATASIEGVRVEMGDALDISVLATDSISTIDPERQDLDGKLARSAFYPARIHAGDLDVEVPPIVREAGEHGDSYQEGTQGEFDVTLPPDPVTLNATTNFHGPLRRLVEDHRDTLVPQGTLTDGTAYVGRQRVSFDGTARTTARSGTEALGVLGGLVDITDTGLGGHGSWATAQVAGAETREFNVASLRILDVGSLFNLLDIEMMVLPSPVLAPLADALGVSRRDETAGSMRLDDFPSWTVAGEQIDETFAAVHEAAAFGIACAALDTFTTTRHGFDLDERLGDLGIEAPDCVRVLDVLDVLLEKLESLRVEFQEILVRSVSSRPLVTLENAGVTVRAVAGIDDDGTPLSSTSVVGGIEAIHVGRNNVGSLDLTQTAEEWNDVESAVNSRLGDVLGVLGDDFRDIVRVRLVAELVERGEVDDGGYVRAHARVVPLRVVVDPPTTLPDLTLLDPLLGLVNGGLDLLASGAVDLTAARPIAAVTPAEPATGRSGSTPLVLSVLATDATAEYIRADVTLQCEAGCLDWNLTNRTWSPSQGFGPPASAHGGGPGDPGDPGRLPQTGGSPAVAIGALMLGSAFLVHRLLVVQGRGGSGGR